MKHWLAFLCLVFVLACAFTDRVVRRAEDGLDLGQKAVDTYVEAQIAYCRAKLDVQTEEQRALCTADASALLSKTEPAVEAAGAAVAAYWSARSVHDEASARRALRDLAVAVEKLPPEYFGDVLAALQRFR